MELRPRKGRSVQPPSTPTIAKPSPKPPPQSSSRKKQASVPSTPIHILSDNEDEDPKEIRMDPIDGAPTEIHAGKVAATASSENRTLKQGNQDINLSDDVEFETPLSSIVSLRRAQTKVSSSSVKSKTKVTASNKKKMAKLLGSTPVADTCISHDTVAATVGLDENVNSKVFGALGKEAASEEIQKQEAVTGIAPQKGDELAVEITLSAQELSPKKTQILSPSIGGKQVHSSKKKSGKKRNEKAEVVDTKLDQVGHRGHIADVDAPLGSEPQTLSLVLSDDETVQVLDAAQVDGREEKILASKEAALEKSLPSAEVSKMSRESKKSQTDNKNIMEDEGLNQKLFEERSDATISCMDTKPDDRSRNELGSAANSSKERTRQTESFEVKDYAETGISTGERHSIKSPRTSLKGREVADIDSNGDKLDDAFDRGIIERDTAIESVQEVSEESSDEAASPGEEMDKEISSVHAMLNAATASSQKNVVHDKERRSSDDGYSNASSGSDTDDEEDEMASIFFKSMKANLQRISEPGGLSMQKADQTKQDALMRLESQSAKSAVKKPSTKGGSTGYGLSWCPDLALLASKTSKAQVGKPQSVVEASADTFWGKNRCLQDGLCVPPVDPLKLNKLARKQKEDTAGAKWFNLSAPTITPEIKKELQLVKLRGALDPKRHYKADDSKGLPKYFQVGTVVGGPADFYSGRLTKKEQKSSLASELLSDSSLSAYRKRKYLEIQEQKQAGGKGFWKKKKSKRTPAWANI